MNEQDKREFRFDEARAERYRKKPVIVDAYPTTERLVIPTLEGDHSASPGDYIIRGAHGECYPCKPGIFAATYESVAEAAEDKRDLAEDLALCEAATPGPVRWRRYGGRYLLESQQGPLILGTTWEETEEGNVVKDSIAIAARVVGSVMLRPLRPEHPDVRRIAESWDGWPHAIRRALKAEARVKELEAQAVAMRVALQIDELARAGLLELEKVAKAAIDYRKAKRTMGQNSQTPVGFGTWMRYVEVEATLLAAVEELEEAER